MAANYLWSFVWESPLKKEMSAIEMKDLKIENTKSDRFGDVLLLVDKKKSTGYAGRKFKEDAFSNAETKKSVLKEFPKIASQLCSISHDNIERMHSVFFCRQRHLSPCSCVREAPSVSAPGLLVRP